MAQVLAVDLLHVRLLDIRDEAEGQYVPDEGNQENGAAPGDKRHTPEASSADDALRVVQEAVDGLVCELSGAIEEEVAVEPAKLAKGLVDAGSRPDLKRHQADADHVLQQDPAVTPIRRIVVHLPARSEERDIAQSHAQVVHALPLAPSLRRSFAKFEKVPGEHLLVGLLGQNDAEADRVPQAPNDGVDHEKGLVGGSGRSDEGEGREAANKEQLKQLKMLRF